MYPGNYNNDEWLGYKSEPIEEVPKGGSVARAWQWREWGINPPNQPPNKTVLENIAEDILVQKPLQITSCDLPGYPRSTFLMVFSPDGTKLASTHGNHNIYVSELASGKHVRILKGHPRTPWCIAFHPSHPQLIGSGCLGGQVRVWDIASGGSEVWNVRNETVIASIAFHPREQLLVIATCNELYFWDWSKPAPFSKVSTNNINEKVRYVAFDSLGFKLITGISLWACASNANSNPLATQNGPSAPGNPANGNPRADNSDPPARPARPADTPGAAQDMIVNSYQTLVQRYDSLVRNYQRLFMVRHRLINTPLASTIDRGTDPMETFPPEAGRPRRRFTRRSPRGPAPNDPESPNAGPSRPDAGSDAGSARLPESTMPHHAALVMAEQLAIDPESVRETDIVEPSVPLFRSAASAFQPLGDERTTRLLPNPFSSTNGSPRQPNSSRTSGIFRGADSALSALRQFSIRRRNLDAAEIAARNLETRSANDVRQNANTNSVPANTDPAPANTNPAPPAYTPPPLPTEPPPSRPPPPPEPAPGPSTSARTTSNSATQINPDGDANSINESLDLIRDILRDSGTRLLNLITNMSMNILSNSDRDEGARDARARLRVFTGTLRREFLASDSESEGDNAHPEVNILRTPNSTFREGNTETPETNRTRNTSAANSMTLDFNEPSVGPSRTGGINISTLITFEPDETRNEGPSREGGITVSQPRTRIFQYRVRTQGDTATSDVPGPCTPPPGPVPAPTTASTAEPRAEPSPAPTVPDSAPTPAAQDEPRPGPSTAPDFDPTMPSTSREGFWSENPDMEPALAFRRVRLGVAALQKHTLQLANMWLRGDRTSLRDLRTMWEDLRRRIITLNNNRQNRTEARSFYTRSLLERCMILTEMTEMTDHLATRQLGRRLAMRRTMRREESTPDSNNGGNDSNATTSNATPAAGPSTSADNNESRSSRPARGARNGSQTSQRKRLQPSYRWRPDDELRRRARNPPVYRIPQLRNRNRGELVRSVEMNATRHVIRTRAMKVLSVMFNMMMMCLDERGLSQLIINMLKTLKKALALTCFMMMSNRIVPRSGTGAAPAAPNVDSADVVRIQNVEHPGPVNVDGPDDATTIEAAKPSTSQASTSNQTIQKPASTPKPSTSQTNTPVDELPSPSPNPTAVGAWSHRLAVQIAAANRNNSVTAKTRREMYLEARRQKALHRTNPVAHPFIRRRFPPVAAHRIPALRSMPPGRAALLRMARSPELPEPTAGPSIAPLAGPANQYDQLYQIGNRDNVIRLAHLRLRTAARNQFRRLQTIRLYTPSSVREMFALQDLPRDNPTENNSPEENGPRPFGSGPQPGSSRELGRVREFHAMLSSDGLALPLMQVNELSPAADAAPGQPGQAPGQRLPRIHEYLQPIILAQNAMVVDEDEGGPPGPGAPPGARRLGGMAGLLDAGIISEALPAPSHRVQAWDFTTGAAPDIADNTKNVVVQRCRIHNDASIDISKDGRLLVALLPVPRLRNTNNWLGVYSLEWPRLGQCLHTAVLEQSAVSVALSPTARYLAVGLGSRRFTSSHSRTNIIALLYKLDPLESSSRTGLSPMKELEQYWEHGFTSLNCLRWAPQPGQGLVYANNTGQLIIMS